MKDKNLITGFILCALAAFGLISFGYLIDSDPPYDNIWHTVREFAVLWLIVFALLSLSFFASYKLYKQLSEDQ